MKSVVPPGHNNNEKEKHMTIITVYFAVVGATLVIGSVLGKEDVDA